MLDAVLDANVLIDFARAEAHTFLAEHMAQRARVVKHIHEVELAHGTRLGWPHPCFVDGDIWPEIIELDSDEFQVSQAIELRLGSRHRGEADSIAAASSRGIAICTRDADARREANRIGVATLKTIDLLNHFIGGRACSFERALEVASAMVTQGRAVEIELLQESTPP